MCENDLFQSLEESRTITLVYTFMSLLSEWLFNLLKYKITNCMF